MSRMTIQMDDEVAARLAREGPRSTVVPRILRRYFAEMDAAVQRIRYGEAPRTAADHMALIDLLDQGGAR